MAARRNPRLDSRVRSALAGLLDTEIQDPRIAFVTITEVEVTPDHDVAVVYWSSLDPDVVSGDPQHTGGDRVPSSDEVAAGLESAAPRLRSLLLDRVEMRVAPQLRFRPDPVVEQSTRVESLLREMREGDA